ncbi:hypothetical protein Unana1_02107 [Umbelopsis nana]
MQLVMGRPVTATTDKLPHDFIPCWETILETVPGLELSDVEKDRIPAKSSSVLSVAGTTLATAYSNHIVENFEGRICGYIKHKLSQAFPNMTKKDQAKIAEEYAFPRITGGSSSYGAQDLT